MQIRPLSIDQIALGEDGRQYLVTGEAGRIVQRLAEIDETLTVIYNEAGEFFTVAQRVAGGDRPFPVMRVHRDDWNDRIVEEFAMRNWELRHGLSAADRLDAELDARRVARERDLEEAVGEAAYPLFRAFQKDVGTNPRVYLHRRRPALQAA